MSLSQHFCDDTSSDEDVVILRDNETHITHETKKPKQTSLSQHFADESSSDEDVYIIGTDNETTDAIDNLKEKEKEKDKDDDVVTIEPKTEHNETGHVETCDDTNNVLIKALEDQIAKLQSQSRDDKEVIARLTSQHMNLFESWKHFREFIVFNYPNAIPTYKKQNKTHGNWFSIDDINGKAKVKILNDVMEGTAEEGSSKAEGTSAEASSTETVEQTPRRSKRQRKRKRNPLL